MRRYRIWAGSPSGTPEDKSRCVAEIADGGRSFLSHQCRNKRGKGPRGLWCAIHARMIESVPARASWLDPAARGSQP